MGISFVFVFCIIGVFSSIFFGIQFISKGRKTHYSNYFLGTFFLLISARLGKLFIQELDSGLIQDAYFNLMHASYLGLGPLIWLYTRSYLSTAKQIVRCNFLHFIPSLLFLTTASQIRYFSGESTWLIVYWIIQIHPLAYVTVSSLKLFQPQVTPVTLNQSRWLYSVLSAVAVIAIMNILYFILDFEFYLVTSSLLIITSYLIISIAFSGNINIMLGKSDLKYKNLLLSDEDIVKVWDLTQEILTKQELYLTSDLKLADVAKLVGKPPSVISMVINTKSGSSFSDYINSLRIDKAQDLLLNESEKKIIAIAIECGFSSISAFNKAFLKNTGLSPSKFRSKSNS